MCIYFLGCLQFIKLVEVTHKKKLRETDLIRVFHKIEGPRETSLYLHALTFELRLKQLVVIPRKSCILISKKMLFSIYDNSVGPFT